MCRDGEFVICKQIKYQMYAWCVTMHIFVCEYHISSCWQQTTVCQICPRRKCISVLCKLWLCSVCKPMGACWLCDSHYSLSLSLSVCLGVYLSISWEHWSECVCSQSTAIILFILRYAAIAALFHTSSSALHIGSLTKSHTKMRERDRELGSHSQQL